MFDLLRESFVREERDSEFQGEILNRDQLGDERLEKDRINCVLRVLVDYKPFEKWSAGVRLDFDELSCEFLVGEFHWLSNRSLCLCCFVLELKESSVYELFDVREGWA